VKPRAKVESIWADGVDAVAATDGIRDALDKYLIDLTGDVDRDIERFDHKALKVDGHGNALGTSVGYWANIARLELTYLVWGRTASVEIALKATSYDLDVSEVDYGDHGNYRIGNRVHVAALLHVFLWVIRVERLLAVTNIPSNSYLRTYYTQMGFLNGERLEIGCPQSVETALTFVQGPYASVGLSLSRPPP
jgi:hypothetical protein